MQPDNTTEATAIDTALTDVAAAGDKVRELMSQLEANCNTDQSRNDWIDDSAIAVSKFISAFGVFHTLAQGDVIPTLGPNVAPLSRDSTRGVIAEHIVKAKTPATVSDLEHTLVEGYEMDKETAKAKASDLSRQLSSCLAETMDEIKTKIELKKPYESIVNQVRMDWASNWNQVNKNDQWWIENFTTQGSLAFPTELSDPDELLAQTEEMRKLLTAVRTWEQRQGTRVPTYRARFFYDERTCRYVIFYDRQLGVPMRRPESGDTFVLIPVYSMHDRTHQTRYIGLVECQSIPQSYSQMQYARIDVCTL